MILNVETKNNLEKFVSIMIKVWSKDNQVNIYSDNAIDLMIDLKLTSVSNPNIKELFKEQGFNYLGNGIFEKLL